MAENRETLSRGGGVSRPTLVYGVDSLCGWCFGFADSVAGLRRALDGEVRWEVACGGLVTGARVGLIREAAAYLRAGMRAVEARTPARFGPAFEALLEEGTWVSDSEPSCRATLGLELDAIGGEEARTGPGSRSSWSSDEAVKGDSSSLDREGS